MENFSQRTLKVANWNLQRVLPSQKRLSKIQKFLSLNEADIWFLTETHEKVEPFPEYYSCFSGMPDRTSEDGERWVGIWSRWQIEPLPSFVSDTSRCVAGRISESPLGELIIFGGILPWTNEWRGIPGLSGQAFRAALEVQKHDWLRLQHAFPNASLVVGGDFNQDLVTEHYFGSKLKRSFLESALNECELIPLTGMEDDPIARDSHSMACIDHICISSTRTWNLLETIRWPDTPRPVKNLSDHFGIKVKLDFFN